MSQETTKMNTYTWMARIVGVLFIIGTAAGILSLGFLGDVVGAPDLGKIAAEKDQVLIGVLLLFTMAAACAGTTIWLYPVLKKYSEGLALGAVCFRLVEGVLGMAGAVSLLVLLTLSQEFVKAGAPDASYFQTLSVLLVTGHDWVANGPMILAWCTAALMYYYVFYQTKLIPRWLSVWGLIGIVLSIAATMLVMFGVFDSMNAIDSLMNLPILVQEMVMAIWLIVKGFSPAAIASLSARADGGVAIPVKPKVQGDKA